MIPPKYCVKCGHRVRIERHSKDLEDRYPYYCPKCDENLFRIEVITKRDIRRLNNREE